MKYRHKITGDIAEKNSDNLYKINNSAISLKKEWIENSNDWEKIEEPLNKEQIIQECIKRFPKGSKVKCALHGDIYTIAQKFTVPRKNDWFEGVYYHGSDGNILAVMEGKSRGSYLYYKGKFAELIEEPKKDYEILELKCKNHDNPYELKNNGRYALKTENVEGHTPLEHLLNGQHFNIIYKVKRLSDNKIFRIGDKVRDSLTDNLTNNKVQTISHFQRGNCPDGTSYFTICFESGTTAGLNSIIKTEFLFTTEDGFNVHYNDKVYGVYLPTFGIQEYCWESNFKAFNNTSLSKDVKYFFKKENAEDYVLLNKPCLSINDVDKMFDNTSICRSKQLDYLKQIVKLRL